MSHKQFWKWWQCVWYQGFHWKHYYFCLYTFWHHNTLTLYLPFSGYGQKNKTTSDCYKCGASVLTKRIKPQGRRTKKSDSSHQCNAADCFAQDCKHGKLDKKGIVTSFHSYYSYAASWDFASLTLVMWYNYFLLKFKPLLKSWSRNKCIHFWCTCIFCNTHNYTLLKYHM